MTDIAELDQALARAQHEGRKQLVERTAKLGGQEFSGAPLRWVEIDEPPAVYFPDAYAPGKAPDWVIATLGAMALLSLVLAILSATLSDWLFAGVFAAAMVATGGAALWVDAVISRKVSADRKAVERRGLVLTAEAMILRGRSLELVVPRELPAASIS